MGWEKADRGTDEEKQRSIVGYIFDEREVFTFSN